MKLVRTLALAALFASSAGCLSHSAYRHIYSLDGVLDSRSQTMAASERPVLQLERVLVPDYLDTTDILLRVGAHELRESTTARFGERLSLGVMHALRSDLAARLPQYTVALGQSGGSPARQILVNVDAFEVWPSGHCVLIADWTLRDADRGAPSSVEHGTFTTAAGRVDPGDGGIVAAMADAVSQLADRIASTVEAPSPGKAAHPPAS